MGRQLIEYALADGQSIVVEAEGDAGPVQRGRGDAPVERAAESFEAAVAKLKPAAAAILTQQKPISNQAVTFTTNPAIRRNFVSNHTGAQGSNALHRRHQHIAPHQRTNAGRCARVDQVARFQANQRG